ncbi:MAG: cell division protein FtsI (penicillin-binding protein 3), partial [Polyangiales bacterium]
MHNLSPSRRRWGLIRIGILGAALIVYGGGVAFRAYVLQVERAPSLREMAEDQHLRHIRLAPKRGTIYDRNGSELAVSVDIQSVWANPREMLAQGVDTVATAARLSVLTGVERETL